MNESIYVILIEDRPYRKERAIRTYKTRERAEMEARQMSRYALFGGHTFKVAEFAAVDERIVDVEEGAE
ncbi:hypothetical protein [Paenibacillus xylanexedens]|uniref:hypothetical protein n=1 Tax=Paenibacillus xylanexedens TaxID=528191 RepID=UPI0011A69667|nr:hypothetical protein [Paenibacillus xylanexedens]